MKKILSIILVFCVIFSLFLGITLKAQALNELEISTGGTASKVTYSQTNNSEVIHIFASSTRIVKQFVIPPEGSITYYRIGFEIAEASVPRTVKFDINKGSVKQIRLANAYDPVRTSVVVETTKKPEYTLLPSQDGKYLVLTIRGLTGVSTPTPKPTPPSTTPTPPITTPTPKPSATPKPSVTPSPSVTPIPVTSTPSPSANTPLNPVKTSLITQNGPLSWSMSGDTCVISLNGISLSQTTIGNTPRFELREKEKLLQITIPGKDSRFKNGILSGNSVIYGMLVSYNEKMNCTFIRISYHNTITFTHAISSGNSVIRVKASNTTIPVSSPNPPPATPTPTPAPSSSPTPTPTPTPAPTNTTNPVSGANVSFVFNPSAVTISTSITTVTGVKVYRVGNPSRIVMELSGTTSALDKIMPLGSFFTRATVIQASANLIKVQLFTQDVPDWTLSQTPGKINLAFTKNTLTYIEGGNGDSDGTVALRLVSPGIVNRYRQNVDSIIVDDSVANSTFTYMIPAEIVNIGNGTVKMEDGLTKSIVAFSTLNSSFLLMNKVDPNKQFKIIEGTGPDELLIVVASSESVNNSSKLVVLDPGHGGSDPGGTVGTYFEKVYNLDIALKCEAILKSKGVNVIMTRTTDVFVGLTERADFANDRKASLFVSIHNNIMPTGAKGSMTLYYPSSYDGKAYAQIMQTNMVKDLGTMDLGLRARGDVTVIKKTKMPAILAEVACMSYADDLVLLNTEAFRQRAAESLANSIITIMSLR